MHPILVLVRKDIANFRRNRAAISLTFLIPIALIYVFGQVFGLNRTKDDGPTGLKLAVVNASSHPGAAKLIDALKAEASFRVVTTYETPDRVSHPLTEDEARKRIQAGEYRFALVLPEDLLPARQIGVHLVILSDPRNEIETQMVNGLLQKTIFTSVPQLLGESLQARSRDVLGGASFDRFNQTLADTIASTFGGDAEQIRQRIESGDFGLGSLSAPNGEVAPASGAARTSAARDLLKQVVNIESQQIVGRDVKSPAATRVVGGWAIMFLLFAISGSSAAFFDEKNAGLFQRLLSAPITRAHLLWSRFLFGILLGVFQLTTMFIAGRLMYGIDVFGHFGSLMVVCLAAAAACTSFGMFVAAIAPNAQAASGLATFLVMLMSATGGAWFPLSLMPEFMQRLGKLTIVYWSMEGFAQVLWAGDSLRQLLPTLGVLVGITVLVMSLAIWRLNRRAIFG